MSRRPTPLDRDAKVFAKELVSAARDDAPPAGAFDRALGVVLRRGLEAGTVGAGSFVVWKIFFSAKSLVPLSALAKWAGIGAVGAVLVVGAATPAGRSAVTRLLAGGYYTESGAPAPQHTAPRSQTASTAEGGRGEPPALPIAIKRPPEGFEIRPEEADLRSITPARQGIAETGGSRGEPALPQARSGAPPNDDVPSAPVVDSLVEEVAVLDGARSALAMHKARETLALLAEYRKLHPEGRLMPEATALSIEALIELGELSQAKLLARNFLDTHDRSPLARRVRALLTDGATGSTDR